jgi:outer membrane protein assembly factor BamB
MSFIKTLFPQKHCAVYRTLLLSMGIAGLLAACVNTQAPTSLQQTDISSAKNARMQTIEPAWKVELGRSGGEFFQPIAVDGAIYAATRDGNITKVDAHQGRIIWQKKLSTPLSTGVGSDGQYTVAGSRNGILYTLDEKGELLWKADIQEKIQGELLTPPLVGYGHVLVRAIDGRIHAFDAQTGAPRWIFQRTALPLILHTRFGMRWAGPTALIAGFPGGTLAAISLQTGQAYWETPVAWPQGFTEVERINDVVGTPSLVGRLTCAVTFQGRLACFDAQNGEMIWEKPFSSAVGLDQSAVHLIVVDDQDEIALYDAAQGQLRWKNTQLHNQHLTAPLIAAERVFVASREGKLYGLSLAEGNIITSLSISRRAISAQPIWAGDKVIIQTQGGELYGLTLPAL